MKSESNFREDPVLIQTAKSGDEAARTSLLVRYRPLIDSLVYHYSVNLPNEEREDLAQEAAITFLHALDQFDAEKGISFGYFAKVCISNRLNDYLRKRTTSPTENAVPFEEVILPGNEEDPSKPLCDQEAYLALCNRIRKILSDFEYRVWILYVAGQTASDIAKAMGKDRKSIENTLARTRRKIRNDLSPR